jgi:twitching motility protein PilI
MANREALRELQTRLASRLQAAREEGVAVSWLAVKAGGAQYIFPLAQSGEIFPLASVQPVPYVQSWFLGVINLRGGLHGLVDLAGLVADALSVPRIARPERSASEARVITLNAALEVNCALLVDNLAGLRNLASFKGSVAPDANAPLFFGNCYTDLNGDVWQEIDLRSLSQFQGFLNINA